MTFGLALQPIQKQNFQTNKIHLAPQSGMKLSLLAESAPFILEPNKVNTTPTSRLKSIAQYISKETINEFIRQTKNSLQEIQKSHAIDKKLIQGFTALFNFYKTTSSSSNISKEMHESIVKTTKHFLKSQELEEIKSSTETSSITNEQTDLLEKTLYEAVIEKIEKIELVGGIGALLNTIVDKSDEASDALLHFSSKAEKIVSSRLHEISEYEVTEAEEKKTKELLLIEKTLEKVKSVLQNPNENVNASALPLLLAVPFMLDGSALLSKIYSSEGLQLTVLLFVGTILMTYILKKKDEERQRKEVLSDLKKMHDEWEADEFEERGERNAKENQSSASHESPKKNSFSKWAPIVLGTEAAFLLTYLPWGKFIAQNKTVASILAGSFVGTILVKYVLKKKAQGREKKAILSALDKIHAKWEEDEFGQYDKHLEQLRIGFEGMLTEISL